MNKLRFVFDTNTFISSILVEGSVSAKALDKAFELGEVIVSHATFSEFVQVIFREKFDRYLTNERRFQSINKLERDTVLQAVETIVADCRDPKDNKFLELALDGKASCIVTGDKDLLVLNPFRSISILSATEFLDQYQ